MSMQNGWRWCRNCQGLFFAGGETQGSCFGMNPHDGSASGKYLVRFGEGAINAQPQGGWRWCHKCQGMHFSGAPSDAYGEGARRMCFGAIFSGGPPPDGHHDPSQSGHYVMEFGEGGSDAQGGWRFCKKCFGMFYSGNPDQGHCPAGGKHDNSKSGPYMLHFERDLPESVTLNSGSITSGLSIGGFASLFMGRGGDFTFSGHMHNSGALGIDSLLTLVALTPTGIAYTAQHSDHTAGTFTSGSRDGDWTVPGFNDRIRDNWSEASQATLTWTLHANDTLTPQLGKALEDALHQAVQAVGMAGITALVALL